jgi:hypothetical protein
MRRLSIPVLVIAMATMALAQPAAGQNSWPPKPGDRMKASSYPTRRAASVAAGARAVEMTLATGIDGNSLRIVLSCSDDAVLPEVRQQLEVAFPGKVTVSDEPSPDAVHIKVQVDPEAVTVTLTPPGGPTTTTSGPLDLERGSSSPTAVASVLPFEDKPWADSLPNFTLRDEQGRWIIVHADRPALTPEEAETLAKEKGLELVLPMVQEQLAKAGVHLDVKTKAIEELRQAFERGDLVADRFVTRYDRPFGSVWHGAIKVDASPLRIEELSAGIQLAQHQAMLRLGRAAIVSGVVVTILLVLYALANAVTRGFFTMRLRIATMVLAVVGVWIITRLF